MSFIDEILSIPGTILGAAGDIVGSVPIVGDILQPIVGIAEGVVSGVTGAVGGIAGGVLDPLLGGAGGAGGPLGFLGGLGRGGTTVGPGGSSITIPGIGTMQVPGAGSKEEQLSLMSLALRNGITPPLGGGKVAFTIVAVVSGAGASVRSVERGTPRIMSRDAQKARRIAKTVRKLSSAMPRGPVRKQSDAAKLTEALKNKIMREIIGGKCD